MLPPNPAGGRARRGEMAAREPVLDGWLNIALTVVGLAAIFWLITSSLPWWLNSVWNAGR
jgi:general L-amino acid transport system permease protein